MNKTITINILDSTCRSTELVWMNCKYWTIPTNLVFDYKFDYKFHENESNVLTQK